MKIDFENLAIVIGVSVILLDIFFNNIFRGLNTPVILAALGLVLFALFRKKKNEKNR